MPKSPGRKKLGVSWLLGFKGLGLVNIFFGGLGSSLLHIVKKGKEDRQRRFFSRWVVVPNVKLQKLSSAPSFGRVFTHL